MDSKKICTKTFDSHSMAQYSALMLRVSNLREYDVGQSIKIVFDARLACPPLPVEMLALVIRDARAAVGVDFPYRIVNGELHQITCMAEYYPDNWQETGPVTYELEEIPWQNDQKELK